MLKKLIKHEFNATYRTFIPIYLALAFLTGIARVAMHFIDEYSPVFLQIASGFGIIVVILGFMFVVLSPFIFLTMRFYRTTATREAYLTFTIPADTKLILLAKLIVSYIWSAVTFVLWLFAMLFFLNGATEKNVNLISEMLEDLFSQDNISSTLLYFAVLATTLACSILSIFAAISLGQLVRDHRIIASFAFYAAIYTVQQIVSVLTMLPYMIQTFTSTEEEVIYGEMTGSTSEFGFHLPDSDVPVFVISILLSLAFSVALYFLSNHMMKKKLNLL